MEISKYAISSRKIVFKIHKNSTKGDEKMDNVVIVIPSYRPHKEIMNEFVENLTKHFKEIVVVDDGSGIEYSDFFNKLEDGKTVYEKVAELVNSWGEELVGEYGYSSVSSVVGATYPVQLETLRKIMPTSYFLIPGYGAQGGKAEDIALGFDENGLGGIVNASRSLMCAYKSDRWKDEFKDEEYAKATRAEAIRMRDELNSAIQK